MAVSEIRETDIYPHEVDPKVTSLEDELEKILMRLEVDIKDLISRYGEEYRTHIADYLGASI